MNHQHRRLVTVLAVAFALLFAWSAWRPWHPQDWLLENVPVVAALALATWIYFRVPFSRSSWILVFLFLCFHEIGAHYTYSEVPWRQWLASLTGTEPISGRNHFDRAVHFLYGFLLVVPLRELLSNFLRLPRVWSWLIPIDIILSTSLIYELIEWGAAVVFGGDLGQAYLGTQGDPWDAHRDMALAGLGAIMAAIPVAIWKSRTATEA
jgi:putative membrane protein